MGIAPTVDELFLWPENVPAWEAFLELQTQWRVGFGGAYGLDYSAVLGHLREEYPRKAAQRRDVYRGVRVCEHAVLPVWAEQRRREQEAREEQQRRRR